MFYYDKWTSPTGIFDSIIKETRRPTYQETTERWPISLNRRIRSNVDDRFNKYLIIEYSCAGHKKEDINVSFKEDKLFVKVSAAKNAKGYAAETIDETITLPQYDFSSLKSFYKNGLLKIVVYPKEAIKPTKIEIES